MKLANKNRSIKLPKKFNATDFLGNVSTWWRYQIMLIRKHEFDRATAITDWWKPHVHPVLQESIDEDLVKLTALKMRGSSGTSVWTLMVRGGYWLPTVMAQSPLIYGQFLPKPQKRFLLKRLNKYWNQRNITKTFLACKLIALNKNPGLRHIGIGEILRRIARKVMMQIAKQDVIKDAGCLQLCTGQEARSEAAIHAIFDDNKTEVTLIIDTENAFNINHGHAT